jgi:hypothetical protein
MVQVLLHYNLKKNLKLLELKYSKKKLILIQIKLMNLISKGKIIFVSFLVNPGNKNKIN